MRKIFLSLIILIFCFSLFSFVLADDYDISDYDYNNNMYFDEANFIYVEKWKVEAGWVWDSYLEEYVAPEVETSITPEIYVDEYGDEYINPATDPDPVDEVVIPEDNIKQDEIVVETDPATVPVEYHKKGKKDPNEENKEVIQVENLDPVPVLISDSPSTEKVSNEEVVEENNDVKEQIQESMKKVQKRSKFLKFLIGPNYKEIKKIQNILKTEEGGEEEKIEMQERLEKEKKGFSLLGWLFRLF